MAGDVKIFVVEDHTLTNRGIRELIFEHKGYECAGYAFSKKESLEKLRELSEKSNPPDVVILDLFFGEESGLDLLRELRENFSSVKVLVYSMFEKPGIVSLTLESGANGFVAKSAPESELFSAIENIIAGKNYVQQTLVSPLFIYKSIYDGLTRQEQKVFKCLLEKKRRSQIAKDMNIIERSVENYISRIYVKTGCKNHEDFMKKFRG